MPDLPRASPVDPTSLAARGRVEAVKGWRAVQDRVVASDPGLIRLRHGLRAAVAVATTVGVEGALAKVIGADGRATQLHVMIGAIVGLNMATSIRERRRRDVGRTSLGVPVAAALGAGLATVAVASHPLAMALFVVVTFAAVWVRRFGPRWFALGFIAWQSYFFASFLRPSPSAFPGLVLAAIVAAAWVATLLTTVFHPDPEATVRHIVTSLRARARTVVAAAVEVLDDGASRKSVARLRSQLERARSLALLIDAHLDDGAALPRGAHPARVRRWLVDLEIGLDEVAGSAIQLVQSRPVAGAHVTASTIAAAPPDTVRAARSMLDALGWGQLPQARAEATALLDSPHGGQQTIRRLANGARLLIDSVDVWLSGRLWAIDGGVPAPADASITATGSGTAPDAPSELADEEDRLEAWPPEDFAPVVTLQSGNLPGTAAYASAAVATDKHPWDRWAFTTRQAIQAAVAAGLAVLFGELISPQRYYWAVIAAFVTFTGTATAGETIRKALARVAGTLAGLVAAVGLAQVTSGLPVLAFVVIVLALFWAFYLQSLSAGAMVFFITIALGELYGLLREFDGDLLTMRLAETAAGAVAGIVAALVVLPVSTRGTLKRARAALLLTLKQLLDECADLLDGTRPATDPFATAIALDEEARQVAATHTAVLNVPFLDTDAADRSRRVAILGVCASGGRAVLQAIPTTPHPGLTGPAAVCRVLAGECSRLADVPDLKDQRPARADRPGPSEQVTVLLDGAVRDGAPIALVRRLQRLADALALLTPSPGGRVRS